MKTTLTSSHWGTYKAVVENDKVIEIKDYDQETDPSLIGKSMLSSLTAPTRITQPMVRESFLKNGAKSDTSLRGKEPFVAVTWDVALDLVSKELKRVKENFGNEAIYAGSYGWASAGRFHHAQSQLRRLLNLFGGHVNKRNSYSYGVADVLMPYVIGGSDDTIAQTTTWPTIQKNCELIVCFGGAALKNSQVNSGGTTRHIVKENLIKCKDAGIEFINVSPLKNDVEDFLNATWLPVKPNSDTALMLGIATTLIENELEDKDFLNKYCVGFEEFKPYLLGSEDGVKKSAEWAADICGVSAEEIESLAKKMAKSKTLISIGWALQRAEHGEQPLWMAITLAAMLGQLGTPGGGFIFGLCCENGISNPNPSYKWKAFSQGKNNIEQFIPVARISDMLLNPGGKYEYNGEIRTYPKIKMSYWAGGNPFHHHQDLNQFLKAWSKMETVICHEIAWNPLARYADIILPVATNLERNDLMLNSADGKLVAIKQAIPPLHQSKSDFDICSAIAEKLDLKSEFTEGKSEMEWLEEIYSLSRENLKIEGLELPTFEEFWEMEILELPNNGTVERIHLEDFRADPIKNPLETPTGLIEITSETIKNFNYNDCPGHPTWLAPSEWLDNKPSKKHPLHLLSNQPKTRLHSQMDNGSASLNSKIKGREPATIHPTTAAQYDVTAGDVIKIFNERGACLAGVILDANMREDVIQLATGAWFDSSFYSEQEQIEIHGNPNVLTRDIGSSRLSQGCTALSCLVNICKFEGELPKISVMVPPVIKSMDSLN
ncbi:MAG: molybdopterin-dependent oxidoreductase [Flavobacteriales bacterium]|nr:molybdopterin-dependent oxidoreductase [Flavobacteriales bacterium]